jgi:integrase
MAFTFSRKNSRGKTWYVGYYVNGKFVRKKIGHSKVIAEKARGDIEAKLERGEAGLLKKDYPIRKFFAEYLESTKGVHSASYHNRNERVIRQFERFLDSERPYLTKISQIRPEVIEAFKRFRMNEVTPYGKTPIKKRTINIEVSSIKTFLNKAVRWDMLSTNPLSNVEYLKEDDSKVIRALTEPEAERLLEIANGWFRPVLITALYTGLREGEMINLEWDDIDLKQCIIHIRRKSDWLPKSSGKIIRERDVAIPERLAEFLVEHKKASRSDDNRVFHNKYGEELKPGLRKVLMRLTAKCGFPEVTQFHALRHTYATHLIKMSKDLTVAKEQLGHVDIRTTMRYTDLTKDRKLAAAQLLDYSSKNKKL